MKSQRGIFATEQWNWDWRYCLQWGSASFGGKKDITGSHAHRNRCFSFASFGAECPDSHLEILRRYPGDTSVRAGIGDKCRFVFSGFIPHHPRNHEDSLVRSDYFEAQAKVQQDCRVYRVSVVIVIIKWNPHASKKHKGQGKCPCEEFAIGERRSNLKGWDCFACGSQWQDRCILKWKV